MPDIAMCKGDNCPRKTQCYRYTAPPSEFRQSWFMTAPVKPDGSCTYFYDNSYKENHDEPAAET